MRIFKTKPFTRFARHEDITDDTLIKTVDDIEKGLIDADYGGGLIKQRIAREGEGKSGGHRSIVAFRSKTRSVFMFAFSKNDQDNLTKEEQTFYKKAAGTYLKMTEKDLQIAIDAGELIEVKKKVKKVKT